MGSFFSAVITRYGRIAFSEDDSHETIVRRLGLRDDGHMLHFQRVECNMPYQVAEVEDGERAPWLTDEWLDAVAALARRVLPAHTTYVEAIAPHFAEYGRQRRQAERRYADALIDMTCGDALGPTLAAADRAREDAERALEVYNELTAPALAEYIERISSIEGYIPERIKHELRA